MKKRRFTSKARKCLLCKGSSNKAMRRKRSPSCVERPIISVDKSLLEAFVIVMTR